MHKLKYLTKLDKQYLIVVLLISVIIPTVFAVIGDWRFCTWLVTVVLAVVINSVFTSFFTTDS